MIRNACTQSERERERQGRREGERVGMFSTIQNVNQPMIQLIIIFGRKLCTVLLNGERKINESTSSWSPSRPKHRPLTQSIVHSVYMYLYKTIVRNLNQFLNCNYINSLNLRQFHWNVIYSCTFFAVCSLTHTYTRWWLSTHTRHARIRFMFIRIFE